MHQLLYVSATARDVPEALLADILAASRRNNLKLGVTGMLLHAEGGFLQILEGKQDVVSALYDRIALDKRHWKAQCLLRLDAQPAFADWSMGFHQATPARDWEMFAITASAISGHLTGNDAKVAIRLMENFYNIQTGNGLKVCGSTAA